MARNPYIGVDPQTGDMMITPLAPQLITPAPTYNANAFPFSPSRGVAPQQPVSPVSNLQQVGQAGLEGSRNQQRTAQKVSQKVGGLLGGGETAGGLLSDIQGDAALQGLFATMQAIGRPVRRGEDRYLGAVQYGQGVMQQAQKQGLGDLSTRMQLEKYQMERDALQRKQDTEQKLLEAWSNVNATGGTAVNAASMFGEDLTDQMSDAQKRAADQAAKLQARALQLSALGPQYADATKDLLDQSKVFADQATVGLLTPEKKTNLILSESKTFRKEVYEPKAEIVNARNDIVRLVESNQPASAFLSIVKLVKTAEPDSAVQQGEFTTIAGFNSFMDSVIEFATLQGKGVMPKDMKDKLVRTADALAKGAVQDYSREANIATERYDALKLDSSQIVPEIPPLIDYSYGDSPQDPSDVANRVRSIRGGRTGAGR
jgi:hypothetical protein